LSKTPRDGRPDPVQVGLAFGEDARLLDAFEITSLQKAENFSNSSTVVGTGFAKNQPLRALHPDALFLSGLTGPKQGCFRRYLFLR
jgi:hypothetical protein